jgi:hypothetical protein
MSFPSGEHDDQVDAFVHGINRLKEVGDGVIPPAERMTVDVGFKSIGSQLEDPI